MYTWIKKKERTGSLQAPRFSTSLFYYWERESERTFSGIMMTNWTIKMAFQFSFSLYHIYIQSLSASPLYYLCLQNTPLILNQSNHALCVCICSALLTFKQIFWLIAKHFSLRSGIDWMDRALFERMCTVCSTYFPCSVVIFHF